MLLRPAFQRDASLFRELFKRFLEIQPVDLPVKIEQISGSLTTETIKKPSSSLMENEGLVSW